MKEKVIRCRIEELTKLRFEEWCRKEKTDPSKVLRRFMREISNNLEEPVTLTIDKHGNYWHNI